MSTPDIGALMRRAQEMQTRMAELQRDLARRSVQGSAGAGLVTATISGELRVLQIEIDPQLLAGGDRAMLQDLVAAAINAGLATAQRMVQEEMQRAASAFQLEVSANPGPGAPSR
jgi:DNA-binding YbaB/EbfC family protein